MSSTFELPHHISQHIRTPAELAMIADENWRKSQAQKKAPKVVIEDDPSVKPIDMGKLKRERLKKKKRIARKALAKSKAKKTKKVEVKEVEVKFMAKKKVVVKKYTYQSRKADMETQLKKDVEEFRGKKEKEILGEARRKCEKIMAEAKEKLRIAVRDKARWRREELNEEHEAKLRAMKEKTGRIRKRIHQQLRKGKLFKYNELIRWIKRGGVIGKGKEWEEGLGPFSRGYFSKDEYEVPAKQVFIEWDRLFDEVKEDLPDEDDDDENEYEEMYDADEYVGGYEELKDYRLGGFDAFGDVFYEGYKQVVKDEYFDDERQAVISIFDWLLENYGEYTQFLSGADYHGVEELYRTPLPSGHYEGIRKWGRE